MIYCKSVSSQLLRTCESESSYNPFESSDSSTVQRMAKMKQWKKNQWKPMGNNCYKSDFKSIVEIESKLCVLQAPKSNSVSEYKY